MAKKLPAYAVVVGALLVAQVIPASPAAASGHSGAAGSTSATHASATHNRTVHVSGYQRANGTWVRDYYRAPPGDGLTSSGLAGSSRVSAPFESPSAAADLSRGSSSTSSFSSSSSSSFHQTGRPISIRRELSRIGSSRPSGSASLDGDDDEPALRLQQQDAELQSQAALRRWILSQNGRPAPAPAARAASPAPALAAWSSIYQAQIRTPAAAARRLAVARSADDCAALSRATLATRIPHVADADLESGVASALRWYVAAADSCAKGMRDTTTLRLENARGELARVAARLQAVAPGGG